MTKNEAEALARGLVAFCQRNELLSTESDKLADELQQIAGDEMYISKAELEYWIGE